MEHILAVANKADPRSNQAMTTRIAIAIVLTRMGKPADAIEKLLALRPELVILTGKDSPMVAYVDLTTAEALIIRGKADDAAEALTLLTRADAIFLAALGPDVPIRAETRSAFGRARLAMGQAREAVGELTAAAAGLKQLGEPFMTAQAYLGLADALWQTGDKSGARAAAVAAVAQLDELSPKASPDLRAQILAWQRAHP